MPWSNQGGGWKGNNGGPWGSPPPGGSGGGGGQPPDLEEILRKSQERIKNVMPGGGSVGGKGYILLILLLVVVWLLTGFYRVQPDEQGVVLRFGKYVEQTQPGLNYHLPWPVETALTPKVTRVNRIEVGMRGFEQSARSSRVQDVPEESLMLTGDENIVDVDFTVFWVINNAGDFLFNIQNRN